MNSMGCQKPRPSWLRLLTVAALVLLFAVATPASSPKGGSLSQSRLYSTWALPDLNTGRLVYEFMWGGVTAAKAEWIVQRRTVNGEILLEGRGKAKTLKPVTVFWKMRGTVQGIVRTDPILPQYFQLYRRDNSRPQSIALNFDHPSGILRITRIGKHGQPRNYTRKITGQYDPVSAALALQALDLQDGEIVQVDVQPGKGLYRLGIRVVGRERVAVRAGTFDAVLLSVSVYTLPENEPYTVLRTAKVWVSDDSQRVFLKGVAHTVVGWVWAELVAREKTG